MAPALPLLNSSAALSSSSSSSSSAGSKSKLDVIILSSDDEQEASSRRKRSAPAGSKSKLDVIILSSDDEQEASSRRKRSSPAGSKSRLDVITLSSDDEQEASSWKMSSSVGSKASGPAVLTSSESGLDAQLLADRRPRPPPRNVVWLFADEVNILKALAGERVESGRVPGSGSALLDAISRRAPNLKRKDPTAADVAKKVHNLKERFKNVIAAGGPSDKRRETMLYDLSSEVWPELL